MTELYIRRRAQKPLKYLSECYLFDESSASGGGAGAREAAPAQSLRDRRPEHSPRAPSSDMPRHGVIAWGARWWRALLSELTATALLVGLGVASAVAAPGAPAPPLGNVAAAFGCLVAGLALAFGAASGAHMNPAVTLAAALAGRLAPAPALAYALAQTLGATLGFAALRALLGVAAPAGLTAPAAHAGPLAAAAVEAALTGLLALACLAAWAERTPDAALPLKLGLLVAGLVCAGGDASGASLNPARSFGPALVHGRWEHQWVYWAGPLGGAALAVLLHRALSPREPAPEPALAAETIPLDDKP